MISSSVSFPSPTPTPELLRPVGSKSLFTDVRLPFIFLTLEGTSVELSIGSMEFLLAF